MIYIAFTLIFISNLSLLMGILSSIRNFLPLYMLFCATALYLIGIPLMFDSMFFMLGIGQEWQLLISSNLYFYPYILIEETLYRVAIFYFLFNALASISFYVFSSKHKNHSKLIESLSASQTANENFYVYFFMICGYLGGMIFIAIYGFFWELRGFGYVDEVGSNSLPFLALLKIVYRFLLYVSAVSVFFSVLRKRYLTAIIAFVPSMLIMILTSERPYILPALVVTLFALFYRDQAEGIKLSHIFLALIAAYVIPSLFLYVRHGFDIFSVVSLPYPIYRDISMNNLYYVFSDFGMFYDRGTEGTNSLRLAITGILPSSIFGSNFNDFEDVTSYMNFRRFGNYLGTLHPTIYGWLFLDLKWYGVLSGIFIGIIMALPTYTSRMPYFFQVALFSILAGFVIVALRGSVQFAYSNAIYGIYLLFLVFLCVKLFEKKV